MSLVIAILIDVVAIAVETTKTALLSPYVSSTDYPHCLRIAKQYHAWYT